MNAPLKRSFTAIPNLEARQMQECVFKRLKYKDEHAELNRRLDLEDHQDPARRHIYQPEARSRERAALHAELSAEQEKEFSKMRERHFAEMRAGNYGNTNRTDRVA